MVGNQVIDNEHQSDEKLLFSQRRSTWSRQGKIILH